MMGAASPARQGTANSREPAARHTHPGTVGAYFPGVSAWLFLPCCARRHVMMGCKPRLLVLYLLLSLASVSPPRSAMAETAHPYDGRWAVTFIPDEGACTRQEIEVRVSDGVIGHIGDFGLFTASGEVSAQGQVDASIGTLGIAAHALGHLSEAEGSGTWTFPDRGCAGQWRAQRLL
jgi:hypothetical protein